MKNFKTMVFVAIALFFISGINQPTKADTNSKKNEFTEKAKQAGINNFDDALIELKNGNKRFIEHKLINTDYETQIGQTKASQKPHSIILSCIDSRVPPEIIFDQGIGNIFVTRIAGNVEDENVLGGMEYAVEHSGTKLIVVMGHSHCGAVTGAVKDIKLGNLTQLIEQIKPAIKSDPNLPETIDETARNNVKLTMNDILNRSEVIQEMVHEKKVAVVGAFYDIETGKVTFMD